MYVSYGVSVGISVIMYLLTLGFNIDLGPTGILMVLIGSLIVLMPYIGAVSKSIWAHLFFKFIPELAQKIAHDSRT
jgi:hypothetical protein